MLSAEKAVSHLVSRERSQWQAVPTKLATLEALLLLLSVLPHPQLSLHPPAAVSLQSKDIHIINDSVQFVRARYSEHAYSK